LHLLHLFPAIGWFQENAAEGMTIKTKIIPSDKKPFLVIFLFISVSSFVLGFPSFKWVKAAVKI
jgi:hypothetical protein